VSRRRLSPPRRLRLSRSAPLAAGSDSSVVYLHRNLRSPPVVPATFERTGLRRLPQFFRSRKDQSALRFRNDVVKFARFRATRR
jgi:hypothetical protein